MGRKARHSSKTGDGGAERRLNNKNIAAASAKSKSKKNTESGLKFYGNSSSDEEEKQLNEESSDEEGDNEEEDVLKLSHQYDSDASDSGSEEEQDNTEVREEEARIAQMSGHWGRNKENFYSADIGNEKEQDDEELDEIAQDEEEAALEIQRKQAEALEADQDFFQDSISSSSEEEEEAEDSPVNEDEEKIVGEELASIPLFLDEKDEIDNTANISIQKVKKNFQKLSKNQKLQVVSQSSPELLGLIDEFQKSLKTVEKDLTPLITKLQEVGNDSSGLAFFQTKRLLLLNYCVNISFYLLAKSKGQFIRDHPVISQILQFRQALDKLEPINHQLQLQIPKLFVDGEGTSDKEDVSKKSTKKRKIMSSKTIKKHKSKVEKKEIEEATDYYKHILEQKDSVKKQKKEFYSHEPMSYDNVQDSTVDPNSKRGATYQIVKNRGLTAHKSKINRNPRVKKRMQYRKAVIRRKGQIREVRTGEVGSYGGELTGIKSNLTRSRKINV